MCTQRSHVKFCFDFEPPLSQTWFSNWSLSKVWQSPSYSPPTLWTFQQTTRRSSHNIDRVGNIFPLSCHIPKLNDKIHKREETNCPKVWSSSSLDPDSKRLISTSLFPRHNLTFVHGQSIQRRIVGPVSKFAWGQSTRSSGPPGTQRTEAEVQSDLVNKKIRNQNQSDLVNLEKNRKSEILPLWFVD